MKKDKFDYAVVGLSHLGLVTSLGLASLNQKTLGINADPSLLSSLNKGNCPVHEPGLDHMLKKYKHNISFSTDFSLLKEVDCIFFSQDTATDGSG